jgi:flagellar motor switch protein FliN
MTPEQLPSVTIAVQDYARIWAESTASALGKVRGTPFTAAPQTPALASAPAQTEPLALAPAGENADASAAAPPDPAADNVSLRFKVSGRLSGSQSFHFSRSAGVLLSQILMSEPPDAAVAFNEGHLEALRELFNQFAGLAATACKARYGGAVEFALEAETAPVDSKSGGSAVWEFTSADIEPTRWTLLIDSALELSLDTTLKAQAEAAAAAPPASAGAPPGASSSKPSSPATSPAAAPPSGNSSDPAGTGANLDLLLDVFLAATLRFGQKDMLLRDILELRPGSVIELNRRIQEPAELLVAGRVVARGEVVIVDGSYGLRITDVTQAHQRLESIDTATGARS